MHSLNNGAQCIGSHAQAHPLVGKWQVNIEGDIIRAILRSGFRGPSSLLGDAEVGHSSNIVYLI